MTTHTSGTREEWLAARRELLEAEKELTRRSDELAQRRQAEGAERDRDLVASPRRARQAVNQLTPTAAMEHIDDCHSA